MAEAKDALQYGPEKLGLPHLASMDEKRSAEHSKSASDRFHVAFEWAKEPVSQQSARRAEPVRRRFMSEIERESMEFDVVIVGAGPAGLAAAIRLKQVNPELSVVVLEKGAEVGAHILSGAVVDPIGIDRLLPGWRDEADHPFKTPVTDDHFLLLGRQLAPPAEFPDAAADEQSRQLHRLARQCLPLAGRQGRGAGRRDLSGLCRRRPALQRAGAVIGVDTGDMGVERDGTHGPNFAPGMALIGKYVLIGEGARGSLAKQLIAKYNLSEGREPGKYGIGLKELWQVKPENHKPGLVQHSFGWPLDMKTGGGSFLYHLEDNQVAVGFVVHLNYKNPYLSPFEEFQRFKTHPAIRGTFEGAKRISYGARAITEGGWQSVPKLSFPGGALIGCSAGFVNVPRIKGSHNAVLSGMLAAEHVAKAIAAGRANDELDGLRRRLARQRHRQGPEEGPQRQAAVVALRHGHRRRARRPRHVAEHAVRLLALRHAEARQGRLCLAGSGLEAREDRLSEARRRADLRPALVGVPVEHQPRGRPADPPAGQGHGAAEALRARRLCRPVDALLPGGVYEWVDADGNAAADPSAKDVRFVINAQNCVHCKTCDIKDPNQNINWVPPQGGEGPVYPNM